MRHSWNITKLSGNRLHGSARVRQAGGSVIFQCCVVHPWAMRSSMVIDNRPGRWFVGVYSAGSCGSVVLNRPSKVFPYAGGRMHLFLPFADTL